MVWNDVVLLTSALGDGSPPKLAVLCFRRHDGEFLWRAEAGQAKGRTHTKNGHASASVTTDGERVYAFFGAAGLFCFDFSGAKVWHAELGGLVYRNRLYLVSDGGVITCYNAGDGTTIWRNRLRGTFTASLVAADGRLYATNERGTVWVIAAGDDFELLGRNDLADRCLATPAVVGKEIFIRTQSYLYCMGTDSLR